jgi:hypothetical protein
MLSAPAAIAAGSATAGTPQRTAQEHAWASAKFPAKSLVLFWAPAKTGLTTLWTEASQDIRKSPWLFPAAERNLRILGRIRGFRERMRNPPLFFPCCQGKFPAESPAGYPIQQPETSHPLPQVGSALITFSDDDDKKCRFHISVAWAHISDWRAEHGSS